MAIIFVDVETTDLDPMRGKILEVAAIATDDNLVELGRFHAITDEASRIALGTLDPVVQRMHLASGLWLESASLPTGDDPARMDKRLTRRVDVALAEFIEKWTTAGDVPRDQKPQLGGSTVDFDRAWMQAHLPTSLHKLHYRSIDATTLNEVARRHFPRAFDTRPLVDPARAHRAMADLEASLGCVRHYRATFDQWRVDAAELERLRLSPTITVKVPDDPDIVAALARLGEMQGGETHRAVIIDSSPTPDIPDDVMRGLRAITTLPSTSLSKSLRTDDVAAAIAWLRDLVPGETLAQAPAE